MALTQGSLPSIETLFIDAPPVFRKNKDKVDDYIEKKLQPWLETLMFWGQDIDSAIKQTFVLDEGRFIKLSAGTIEAGTIFTQDLFLGSDEKIKLLGSTDVIEFWDNTRKRIAIGKLGTGSTQKGIQVIDSAGTIIFQASDTTFLDGAVIKNASIATASIVDAAITTAKIGSAAVTNAKIGNLAVTNGKIGNLAVDTLQIAGQAVDETKRITVFVQTSTYAMGTVNANSTKGISKTFTHSLGVKPVVIIHLSNATFNGTNVMVSAVVGDVTTTAMRIDLYYFNNTGFNISPGNVTVEVLYW